MLSHSMIRGPLWLLSAKDTNLYFRGSTYLIGIRKRDGVDIPGVLQDHRKFEAHIFEQPMM